jgi:hypothetical protein
MAIALAGLFFVPVALGILVAGVVRLVDTLRSHGAARAAQARSLAASAATGGAGLAATLAWLGWASSLDLDLRLATLPALGCTVAVLTAAVAELTWPRPTGVVRTASLAARRTPPPAWLPHLVGVGLVATVTALVIGTLTAAADGRSFARSTTGFTAAGSPNPGSSYAVAVGVAVVVLAVATWFGWARVDARPALGPGHEALDAAVRGASMVRVLRPAAVGFLSTAAGLWLTMGATVNSVTQNLRMNDAGSPRPPFDWVQDLGVTATAIGLALLLLTLVALGVGSPRLPRQETAPAPAAVEADA